MTNQELSLKILELVGGKGNVVSAANCMTRLRIQLRDNSKAQIAALKATQARPRRCAICLWRTRACRAA